MALTKAAIRTAVRQMIDDPQSKRWSDGNLDQSISMVLDDIWGDLLDVAPYINSQYQQIGLPLHAPGYIDLRLTDFGGDLIQRFYRLQQCIADGRQYFTKDPRDYLMVASSQTNDVTTIKADTGVEQRYSMQFLGNQLWLHPLGQVTTFVELRYNYKPIEFTKMTDGLTISLPEGNDNCVIMLAAAQALTKGNAEEAQQFFTMGNQAKDKMMNSIRRQYHGMTQPFAPQNMWEIGGI